MVKDLIKEIVITEDDKPGKRKALDAGAAQKVVFSFEIKMAESLILLMEHKYKLILIFCYFAATLYYQYSSDHLIC